MTKHEIPIEDSVKMAYSPYRREALRCLIIDIAVAAAVSVLFFLVGAQWFLLILLPLFFVWESLVNYIWALLSFSEVRGARFETASVELIRVKDEHSASGHFGSALKELYPKSLHVGRYRILCRDGQGRKIVLRCIMSEEKWQILRDGIDVTGTLPRSVTFGKRSHILLSFNDGDALAEALNHKL